MATAEMKIGALAPWFGSSRMIGEHVGKALEGCTHVTVPFLGGGCELVHIKARTLVCGDLHGAMINLARIAADPFLGVKLYRRLRRIMLSDTELYEAQEWCKAAETHSPATPSFEWAEKYFLASWMGMNGHAGKAKEFDTSFSVRYDAGGGDSAVRVRNATKSIIGFRRILMRATFICMDAFELLPKVKDDPDCGLYIDAPWPKDGDCYKHPFTVEKQERLATELHRFKQTRVVIRYGRHPLIERLYPTSKWDWTDMEGRTSGNRAKQEVLIVNRRGEDEARLF